MCEPSLKVKVYAPLSVALLQATLIVRTLILPHGFFQEVIAVIDAFLAGQARTAGSNTLSLTQSAETLVASPVASESFRLSDRPATSCSEALTQLCGDCASDSAGVQKRAGSVVNSRLYSMEIPFLNPIKPDLFLRKIAVFARGLAKKLLL